MKLVIEKKKEKMVTFLSKSILTGQTLNQRKLDYERGFWDGAMHVVTRPENAEVELTAALKRLEEGMTDAS